MSAEAATSDIRQVGAVFRAKSRMGRHQIASVRNESKLKVAVVGSSAVLLWVGAFVLFYWGFTKLLDFGGRGGELSFGYVLMAHSLGVLSLSVFLLLVFSNVLVAFSTLYKSKEVVYLLQGPITYRHFFYARFFECLAFSSWSIAYLGTPLMLAYGLTTDATLFFYASTALFFLPYIIIPACMGCLATIVLVRFFPRLKLRVMIGLGMTAVGVFFWYIRGILRDARTEDADFIQTFLAASSRTQSPFLPSYWATQGVLAAARIDLAEFTFYLLLLLANAVFFFWFTGEIAHRLFYPGWSFLMGQDKQRIKPLGRGPLGKLEPMLRRVRNPERALVIKDIKLFWRDPTQWSQFVIFFGIMAIYIANLRNTNRFDEQPFWRSWIACLNVGSVTLILATLTSRFVFPLVSLEGRRFWILGLAPLTFKNLVWQKFWLSVCTTSLFTVGLAMLSGYMLRLEPIYFALTVYSVIITNFGLAGLAVGLGTLYPTFTEDNPARIVSGMGGTLNLLVSVGYITLVVAAQTIVLQWRILERYTSPGSFWYALAAAVAFITLLSIACTLIPMRLGLRNLNDREF